MPNVQGQEVPEDAFTQTQEIFDVDKILPEPMTAKGVSRMYANEWVELCLKSQKEGVLEKLSLEEVKRIAVEVYGQFNYLLLTARLKTRNAVIKSRKKVEDINEIYGASLPQTFFPPSEECTCML